MLAAIAEFDTAIRAEGLAKAQANIVQLEVRQKRSDGVLIRELMVEYGLSKTSIYRLLRWEDALK